MRLSRQRNLQSPPAPQRVSRGTVALLGGLCAVAVLLSGVVIAGFVAPDQLRTAAISAATPDNEKPAPAATAPAPTVAPKPTPVQATTVSTPKVDRATPPVAQAAAQEQPAAVAPLPTGDTRWAKPVAPKQEEAAEVASAPAAKQPSLAAGPNERGAPQAPASEVLAGMRTDTAPDASATASIPTIAGSADDVQVAESEAEVAKLEAATGMVDGQAASQPPTDLADKPLPTMKTARVTKYVNLRAGPADESRVIAVVPANAEVKVESGCQWCTVVYNGQRGYIYKSFIRRSLKEAAAEGTGLF